MYFIKYTDVYKVKRNDPLEELDRSDYDKDDPFNMPRESCEKLGLMKDELNSNTMLAYVKLRAKLYSMHIEIIKLSRKAKESKSMWWKKLSLSMTI